MKPVECEFESEVLAAVLQSRWPARVDAELRAHVGECGICSDVVAIAGVIDDAREQTRASAVLPDAGRVWWLAQLRARREAVEAAGRPIAAAQAIAFGCAIGLLGACFGAMSAWFHMLLPSAMALVAEHGVLVFAMAALLLLVPAAACVAVLRD